MNSRETSDQFADVRTHVPFLARHEGVARVLEGLLGYPEIRKAFADSAEEENPFLGVAKRLCLEMRVEDLAGKIPASGPVIVVANHGYGGADALALMAVMTGLRRDFKVLANREVSLLDGTAPHLLPVNILDPGRTRENTASLRATLKHVRAGGALGVFPAGRVAYWKGDRMMDPPWNDHVVKLVQRLEAPVVPLWFYGSPPAGIKVLSRFSGFLRTALIPTGLARMKGCEIVARAGEPVTGQALRELGDRAGPWLRRRLESLAHLGN